MRLKNWKIAVTSIHSTPCSRATIWAFTCLIAALCLNAAIAFAVPVQQPPKPPDARGSARKSHAAAAPTTATREASPNRDASSKPEHSNKIIFTETIGGADDHLQLSGEENIVSVLPVIATDLTAPAKINVGEPFHVTIAISNFGQDISQGIQLQATLPRHLRLLEASVPPQPVDGGKWNWDLQPLAPEQKAHINLKLMAEEKGAAGIETQLVIPSRARVEMGAVQAELKVQMDVDPHGIVGKDSLGTIVVANHGDGAANDLQLQLQIPAGIELISHKDRTMEIGYLGPGESRELTFAFRPITSGSATLQAIVRGPYVPEQVASQEVAVVRPELTIAANGPKINFLDKDGTYSIQVTNPGDIVLNDVQVIIDLPAGMNITTVNRPGDVRPETRRAIWRLANMAPGQSETIMFKANNSHEGERVCQITVKSQETDPTQHSLVTHVTAVTELEVQITNVSGPILIGDNVVLEVKAINKGSRPASNVNVQVDLPNWLVPQPADHYTYDQETGRVTFKSISLRNAQETRLRLTATCHHAGNHVVSSSLSHESYPRPLIAETSVFVLESGEIRVGDNPSKKTEIKR